MQINLQNKSKIVPFGNFDKIEVYPIRNLMVRPIAESELSWIDTTPQSIAQYSLQIGWSYCFYNPEISDYCGIKIIRFGELLDISPEDSIDSDFILSHLNETKVEIRSALGYHYQESNFNLDKIKFREVLNPFLTRSYIENY